MRQVDSRARPKEGHQVKGIVDLLDILQHQRLGKPLCKPLQACLDHFSRALPKLTDRVMSVQLSELAQAVPHAQELDPPTGFPRKLRSEERLAHTGGTDEQDDGSRGV